VGGALAHVRASCMRVVPCPAASSRACTRLALTTQRATPATTPAAEVDIESLPRRRSDNARILDRAKYAVKLYTSDGGTKLLRRCA
jgi:hypothetical protein